MLIEDVMVYLNCSFKFVKPTAPHGILDLVSDPSVPSPGQSYAIYSPSNQESAGAVYRGHVPYKAPVESMTTHAVA